MATPTPHDMSHPEPDGSNFFRALAEAVLSHRGVVLLGVAVVAVACLASFSMLRIDIELESYLDQDSVELQALEDYREVFGRDDRFMVLVEGDVYSMAYLERLRALHEALDALDVPLNGHAGKQETPHTQPQDDWGFDEGGEAGGWGDEAGGSVFDDIVSLVTVRNTRAAPDEDSAIQIRGLLDPWPQASDLPSLEQRVRGDPSLLGRVTDAQGRYSVISLQTPFVGEEDTRILHAAIGALLETHREDDFEPVLAGIPAVTATLDQLILDEVSQIGLGSLVILSLVTLFLYRHPIGLIAPMSVVLLAVFWMYGFMAVMDYPLTFVANVLPSFVLCVGIADAIHIQSTYRDLRGQGVDNHAAIVESIARNGLPITFTTLTTMVGLLSFNLATIDAVGQTGSAGAVGVFAALVHTFLVLPVMLSFNTRSLLGARGRDGEDWLDAFLDRCAALSGKALSAPMGAAPSLSRTRLTVLVAAGLAVAAAIGISRVGVVHDPLTWIDDDTGLRTAFEVIDDRLGGSSNVQLLIRPKGELGMKDAELIAALDELGRRAMAYEHPRIQEQVVGDVVGLPELVKEAHRAFNGGDPAFYELPNGQQATSAYLETYALLGRQHLDRLTTPDFAIGQMTLRTRWLEATAYGPLRDFVAATSDELLVEHAEVRVTGAAVTVFATVSSLISSLITSFGTALLVITPLMVLALRDVKLGLIAMVPNLLPIALVLGFMGYSGMPIDISNVLLSSFAIGLVVDDTIHFLHHFKVHYEASGDVEAAIDATFRHVGRALVSTSLMLSTGFLVLLTSAVSSTVRFGALLILTILVALLADLLFAPAILRLAYRNKPVE